MVDIAMARFPHRKCPTSRSRKLYKYLSWLPVLSTSTLAHHQQFSRQVPPLQSHFDFLFNLTFPATPFDPTLLPVQVLSRLFVLCTHHYFLL